MSSNHRKHLDVLYQTDDGYAVFCGVSLYSLLANNTHIDDISIWIIDDHISSENKQKMKGVAEEFGRSLHFLDLQFAVEMLETIGAPKYRGSYSPYLRLFALEVLPETVERVFYLDADTAVVGSLDELVDFNLKECILGAVKDGLSRHKATMLGYDTASAWINSGVLLVDTRKWRDFHALDKMLNELAANKGYTSPDQDLINIILRGRIEPLHPKYNFTPHFMAYSYGSFVNAFPQEGFYSETEIEEAKNNPTVYHFERFIGTYAWEKNSLNPCSLKFDEYLKMSPWKDYEKKNPVHITLTTRIEKTLFRILPRDIFILLFSRAFSFTESIQTKRLLRGKMDNIN